MRKLGVVALPGSLGEALERLIADKTVSSWMSPVMLQSYVAVKRKEIAMMDGLSADEICARYRHVY
jgi:glutamine synthetase